MRERLQKALLDKDFSELLKKGGVSFFLRIGGQVVGFLLTLLIAQYFGAEGLGEYMLAVVVLRIFTLIAKLGMDTASIRFIASFAKQKKWKSLLFFLKKVYPILVFSSLFFSFIMYSLSDSIANFLKIHSAYIRVFSFFILPMVFFALHYQSLRGLKKIAAFSFFYRMSQAMFAIIIILILLQFSEAPSIPFYAYIISLLFVSILSFISFWHVLKEKINNYEEEIVEYQTLKSILVIALPLMLAQSVQLIMTWTDKIMIGNMMSATDVGIYGVAFKLSMFASITLMAINSIAAPKFAEMYEEKNMDGLKKVAQKSTKIIFWSTLPLVIIFFLFPTFFLGIFGEKFKIGVNAFIILSAGMLISAFSGSVGNLLQMTGKQFVFMKILIVGAIINIGLNYLLIPTNNPFSEFGISGINGAAVASMCSIIFWNLSMVFVVKKQFGFLTLYIPFIKR
jgi:O-antigen/teichoic acid export membrane protein